MAHFLRIFPALRRTLLLAALLPLLQACDPIALDKLSIGQSTEADVRDAMGAPHQIWHEADGSRTLEYNRQPAGHVNYMLVLGPDGRLRAIDQVLNAQRFAKIQPGMHYDQVRRLLGQPAKDVWYPLKQEHHVDWRYLQDATTKGMFTVVLDAQRVVQRAYTGPDMGEEYRSGGRR